ncbi:cytochrome c [Anaerobacillus alkaliphilus]|uniref:Cytochrome c n=1 Tax=Anaerobacillus alkaliphilus TaxID=1548597 RepID=A0A4Q0VTF3_9BACI|nr:cytochrome c [Anaerobacillus alkaliphilus]RXJ01703.1 cytochrome c [Anaerobacillus alkaliphilus]
MKKLLFISLIFLLVACGGNTPDAQLDVSEISLPDTYDEARAQAAYKKSCAACHGGNLQGGGAYPYPITGISKEEMYVAIMEGVGLMPARLVTGEEAENLAVWIAAQ